MRKIHLADNKIREKFPYPGVFLQWGHLGATQKVIIPFNFLHAHSKWEVHNISNEPIILMWL